MPSGGAGEQSSEGYRLGIVPYARVGATVGRVFFVHRKDLT
jgi:hypothetical protein